MRILLSLLLGGVLFASPELLLAQQTPPPTDPQAAEARQRYTSGMAHFQLEEWDQAISEWQTGFRAKPVPQFLYNIAQAYRLSKRYEEAIKFYKKYLAMEPKAPNRAEVDRHITNLSAVLEQDRKAQVAPPVAPIVVRPKDQPQPGVAQPEPAASPAPVVAQPSPAPAVQEPIVKKEDKPVPITKKPWFWGVIGGAAAVVVAVIIVGVVVGTSGGGDDTRVLPLARF